MRKIALAIFLLASSSAKALKVETFSPAQSQTNAAPAVQTPGGKPSGILVASGRLWVKFDPAFSQAQRSSLLATLGCSVARDYPNIGWTLISLPKSPFIRKAQVSALATRKASGISRVLLKATK